MSEVSPGYYTEQIRNDAFLQVVVDKNKLNEVYQLIVARLYFEGDQTMQELSDALGIDINVMCPRLDELRKMKIITNPTEIIFDKKLQKNVEKVKKKFNEKTKKKNSLWSLTEKQLKIF